MNEMQSRLRRQVAGLVRRSRWRRSLGALLVSAAGLSLIACVLYLPLPAIAAFRPTGGVALAGGALLLLLGLLAGAALPVRQAQVVREADRRLGLDGALLTSVQVAGDGDAICRMLVRQTVGRLAGVPARRALPLRLPASALLVPGLMALAVGMALRAGPERVTPHSAVVQGAGEWVRLSGDLREIASGMLSGSTPADAAKLEIARKLMEIESALRHGTLELQAGREALQRLIDSQPLRPAEPTGGSPELSDGTAAPADPGATTRWTEELRVALGREDSPASVVAAGEIAGSAGIDSAGPGGVMAGRGDGAGAGAADLKPVTGVTAEPGAGERTWMLPDPKRFPGRAATGGAVAGTLQNDERALDSASSPLARARRPLTNAEREIVGRYLEALGRESRGSETSNEQARSGKDG